MAQDSRYKDLDLSFTQHPLTGDVAKKTNAEAIKRSVRHLVFMSVYEKPFHPEIQSSVSKLLFSNATPLIDPQLDKEIRRVISENEPRADILTVNTVFDSANNSITILIKFNVFNNPEPIDLEVVLDRTR